MRKITLSVSYPFVDNSNVNYKLGDIIIINEAEHTVSAINNLHNNNYYVCVRCGRKLGQDQYRIDTERVCEDCFHAPSDKFAGIDNLRHYKNTQLLK